MDIIFGSTGPFEFTEIPSSSIFKSIYDQAAYGDYTYVGYVDTGEILLGDVNCDGFVDLLDVQPFVQLLTDGNYSVKADMDSNGVVDLLDVQPFVLVLTGT